MSKFFNGTNGPVAYDGYGHFIGGGEWLDVDNVTEKIQELVERGYLIEVVAPTEEAKEVDSAEGQTPQKRNSRSVKK